MSGLFLFWKRLLLQLGQILKSKFSFQFVESNVETWQEEEDSEAAKRAAQMEALQRVQVTF